MTVHAANDTSPPTDLELMLYADDELDGDRLAAVEAWLAASLAARTKLTALRTVSSLVRERALDSSRADGIAESVMDRIAAEGRHNGIVGDSKSAPDVGSAPAKVVELRRRPATDRSRSVYLIAAGVVAAAAAALLWIRPPAPAPLAQRAATPPAVMAPSSVAADKAADDVEHGVEVAAVDFGARMGAVFYVPGETAASSTTTVVWLSDDSAGEDK